MGGTRSFGDWAAQVGALRAGKGLKVPALWLTELTNQFVS